MARNMPETAGVASSTGAVKESPNADPKDPDAAQLLRDEAAGTTGADIREARTERLELYKLAVEMADRVSQRRTSANNFFLALHAAFASVVTFFGLQPATSGSGATAPPPVDKISMFVIASVGVLLSAAWFLGLRSYRDLNSAKFKVINEMETQLTVQAFSAEWRYLKEDRVPGWRGRYREQGTVESWVPVLFGFVYVIAFLSTMLR